MDNHKQAQALAQTKYHKSVLVLGMAQIVNQQTALVGEGRLGILERHLVLTKIEFGLFQIPLEFNSHHATIVHTRYVRRNFA
jgi:hypothetical protein